MKTTYKTGLSRDAHTLEIGEEFQQMCMTVKLARSEERDNSRKHHHTRDDLWPASFPPVKINQLKAIIDAFVYQNFTDLLLAKLGSRWAIYSPAWRSLFTGWNWIEADATWTWWFSALCSERKGSKFITVILFTNSIQIKIIKQNESIKNLEVIISAFYAAPETWEKSITKKQGITFK